MMMRDQINYLAFSISVFVHSKLELDITATYPVLFSKKVHAMYHPRLTRVNKPGMEARLNLTSSYCMSLLWLSKNSEFLVLLYIIFWRWLHFRWPCSLVSKFWVINLQSSESWQNVQHHEYNFIPTRKKNLWFPVYQSLLTPSELDA